MSKDTGRLLREMNNLSSNMDVLLQELKQSAKATLDSSESIKEISNEIKRSKPSEESQERLFKSITESFSKSISDQNMQMVSGISDTVAKVLSGSVSDFLGNLPNQIAQVKANQFGNFKSPLGGDFISDLVNTTAKSAASKIPGLKDGGTIESEGMVVVGETGPEILNLKKGDEVRTKEQQLFDMLMDEERERIIKIGESVEKSPLENSLSQITTDPNLIEKFVNYTKEELDDQSRNDLLLDPDFLRDEFRYFISEKDRSTFTLDDIQKLTTQSVVKENELGDTFESKIKVIEDPQEIKNLVDFTSLEGVKNVTEVKTTTDLDLEKTMDSKINEDFLLPLKSPDSSFGDPTASTPTEISKMPEKLNLPIITNLIDNMKEKIKSNNMESGTSDLISNSPELLEKSSPVKSPEESKKQDVLEKTQEIKSIMESFNLGGNVNQSPVQESPLPARTSPTGDNMIPPDTPDLGIDKKDLSEMKSLLAAIYQALKSPLTVVNDMPFRPNSNNF